MIDQICQIRTFALKAMGDPGASDDQPGARHHDCTCKGRVLALGRRIERKVEAAGKIADKPQDIIAGARKQTGVRTRRNSDEIH